MNMFGRAAMVALAIGLSGCGITKLEAIDSSKVRGFESACLATAKVPGEGIDRSGVTTVLTRDEKDGKPCEGPVRTLASAGAEAPFQKILPTVGFNAGVTYELNPAKTNVTSSSNNCGAGANATVNC